MPQEAIRVLTEAANRQVRSLIKARDGVDRPELLAEIDQLLDATGSWLNGPSPSGALPQLDGAGESSKDGDAAIALHRSLSGLTRVEASDSRLWNALGLTTYRNYIEQRWGDGGASSEAWASRRVLPVDVSGMRPLARQSLSRLWWTAQVLHDPFLIMPLSKEAGDPYAYVPLAFSVEDLRAGVMERGYWGLGGFPLLLFETIRRLESEGLHLDRGRYRILLRRMLIITGHTRLDYLIANEPRRAANLMEEVARSVLEMNPEE